MADIKKPTSGKENKDPIILDLCAGTGAWSKPYQDAGYDVRLVTLPEHDVRAYNPPADVHGILAAPPCTAFSALKNYNGGATREEISNGLEVVAACLNIIWKCQPVFWALENPGTGQLKKWLGGTPRLMFDPWEYGDGWKKKTAIWGNFNRPMKLFPTKSKGSWVREHDGLEMSRIMGKKGSMHKTRAERRSITPAGFAHAFFEVNR